MSRVIVGAFDSRCSACGGNASPRETGHYSGGPGSMWSPGSSLSDKNGCGVEWDEEPLYSYGRPS